MGHNKVREVLLDLNIDHFINPLLPGAWYRRIPWPASHFLGYRPESRPQKDLPPTLQTLHALISIFAAVLCVTAISQHASSFRPFHSPVLIPSLGAGAILNFVSYNNPASQPRPTIFGQAISAAVGVGISRLFQMRSDFSLLQWIAAPLAVAVAGFAMRLTNCVHPPGGATAALAVVTPEIRAMGWWFIAVITVGTTVMVGVGLVVNNIGRRWPEFWWTPQQLPLRQQRDEGEQQKDEEKGSLDEKSSRPRPSRDGESETVHGDSDLERHDTSETRVGLRCPCCGHTS